MGVSARKVALIAAPVALTSACVGLLFLPGGRSWNDVSQQVELEMACEDAVTARLRHPDVAEFDHRSWQPASGSDPAEVRGVVRTVNGFNAPTRVTYGCQMSGDRVAVTHMSEP